MIGNSAPPDPFVIDVERWVENGDVLPLDLVRQRFWFIGPSNNEIVLVDAGDDAEPPTVGLTVLFPIFSYDVRADANCVAAELAALTGLVSGEAVSAVLGADVEGAVSADCRFMFCSDAEFVAAVS